MLSTALVYEHAFTKYSKRDSCYNKELAKDDNADRPPNFNDWKQVKHLLVFLEVFYNVTLHLSGTLYVTSNLLFFEIVAIYKKGNPMHKHPAFTQIWGRVPPRGVYYS